MTRAARKKDTATATLDDAPHSANGTTPQDVLTRFAALVATAEVDSDAGVLLSGGADDQAVNDQLTQELRLAHDRWGLGLLHLRHEARLLGGEHPDIALLVDGQVVASVSQGARAISGAYASMQALGPEGLSEWGVLPDGHRAAIKGGPAQLRVLIEDARDFETQWAQERGGFWSRTWRRDDTLAVEVHRPASPGTALADAAWDVITGIKDRTFQRELMERSNKVGMLGALLGARHSGAESALERLPEAHFAVSSAVLRQSGREARSLDTWKSMQREATESLDGFQKAATRRLAAVLSSGLK